MVEPFDGQSDWVGVVIGDAMDLIVCAARHCLKLLKRDDWEANLDDALKLSRELGV